MWWKLEGGAHDHEPPQLEQQHRSTQGGWGVAEWAKSGEDAENSGSFSIPETQPIMLTSKSRAGVPIPGQEVGGLIDIHTDHLHVQNEAERLMSTSNSAPGPEQGSPSKRRPETEPENDGPQRKRVRRDTNLGAFSITYL